MADPSLKEKIETRKKALAEVMESMEAPKKEKQPPKEEKKEGITTKNSMMMKPWGLLAKD